LPDNRFEVNYCEQIRLRMTSTPRVLQEHVVFQKTRTQSLADVRTLNMWGHELENISIVSQMTNAETLSFAVNKITSLAPFESCKHLQHLFLRGNRISSFDELVHLQSLPCLTTLSLNDNPIAEYPNYRQIVIRNLPRLRKLDDIDVAVPTRSAVAQPAPKHPPPEPRNGSRARPNHRATAEDANFLAAVLALVPELSPESLRVVLRAIEKQLV
jgi:hypothetical protein